MLKRDNPSVFVFTTVLYVVGSSFLADGYVQAYLLNLRLTVSQIGLYGLAGNAAAFCAYAFAGGYAPRRGNYVPALFYSSLAMLALPALLALGGLYPGGILLPLLGAVVYQSALGLKSACEMSAIPSLFPRGRYGRLAGIAGVLGGGAAAACSALSAWLMRGETSGGAFRGLFLFALVMLAASALILRLYKPALAPAKTRAPEWKKRLKWKALRPLLPHFLRGIANAGMYYFAVVSLRRVEIADSANALIVTVGVMGSMAGCALFLHLEKRYRTGVVIFAANLLCAASALFTSLNDSAPAFFLLYFVYMLSLNVSAYAIPSGFVYCTPPEDMPFLSAARLFAMSAASCAFVPAFAWLLEVCPAWLAMGAAGAAYAVSGAIFLRQYRDSGKEKAD